MGCVCATLLRPHTRSYITIENLIIEPTFQITQIHMRNHTLISPDSGVRVLTYEYKLSIQDVMGKR